MPLRKGWGVATGAATMVLQADLTADDRGTRAIRALGCQGLWRGRLDLLSSDPPDRPDQSLASLAGSAKMLKATTVNAGEGS